MYAISGKVIIKDGNCIPPDPRNPEWRLYQEWIKAGNTPDVEPIKVATATCQLWQLQSVLMGHQWTSLLVAAAALNKPEMVPFFSCGSNKVSSDSATLLALFTAIGLSRQQMEDAVRQAHSVIIP